jgi:GcrA cell cycle regulator
MGGQSPWTHVIISELIQLWSEGRSGAEIARRLNVSRNSVIGKAHRLELPRRPSPIRYSEGEHEGLPPQYTVGGITNIAQFKDYDRYPRLHSEEDAPGQSGEGAIFRIDCCCWPIGDPGQAASSSASNLLCRANRIAKSMPTAPT